jgi:antitoxin component YwqK of YwqJK toxin-antitoxin module
LIMEPFPTKYGLLTGIVLADYYPDGSLKECTVNCPNPLTTPYGELIPQYSDEEARRKYTKSLSFYPNGDLKSISLHKQTPIATPAGTLPAELVTFHEHEKICRIFPLNGKLTGFWSEANEYELAEEFQFKLPFTEFKQKIIGIHFYENGVIRSMTFWPKDSVMIDSPVGSVPIRIGFSLYPDGSLQSLEPQRPLSVDTPIGKITAYDLNASGMSGDSNSLCFTPAGDIRSVMTSSDRIIVTDRQGNQTSFSPGLVPNICDDQKMEPVPLYIEFTPEGIKFDKQGGLEYKREHFTYTVQSKQFETERFCDECSGY